ncbi:hypothetical protein VTL71DRAFT_8989 [Oculimacula yallundae]|uniref:Uncharacterized protein n=1 Tax=Oculimacula yallundae TaxID=86028 RepID=A0ABR4BTG8_9HELO
MALLNPLYSIIVPFLFITTIPVAIFASLTTILAFSLLFLRVLVVYIELALTIIPYWILGPPLSHPLTQKQTSSYSPTSPTSPSLYRNTWSSTPQNLNSRRKKRRGSNSSNISATGSITPISASGETNSSYIGLSQTIGPSRDYEGVGGWRFGDEEDDEGEGGLWARINSRLELPAEVQGRRHRRSLTAGSVNLSGGFGLQSGGGSAKKRVERSYSPEALFMMNTSRARTSPSSMTVGDRAGGGGGSVPAGGEGQGYFPQIIPSGKKRTPSVNTGSSVSSKGESVLSMKQR